jgi:LysR family transcriptional regulator for metE and metH
MELEVRHLRLVQAIAQEGTMTRAARRLHLTQPALSHQLTGLEALVRTSLFRRTPRGMLPTAAGETLLDSAKVVLEELGRARQQLESAAVERGSLRLSTECYTCYHWLPARLRRFQRQFPQVDVHIVLEATRRPLEALASRAIDVAVLSNAPRRKGCRVYPLFEDELVAIVSAEHPLARRGRLRAADFARETLITYAVPTSQLTVFQELLKPAGVTPARVCQVELTEAIVEMVKANLGIAVLARWAVAPHLSAALRAVPLGPSGFRRRWSAVTLATRGEPEYLRAFLELLAGDGTPFA